MNSTLLSTTGVTIPKGLFTTALKLACEDFEKKYDKRGRPYILHLLRVALGLDTNDEELMAIGVLHDSIEDGYQSESSLRRAGMTPRVIEGVKGLTHLPGVDYLDYIRSMRGKLDVLKVKRRDLLDNSNIARLKGVESKDLNRLHTYALSCAMVEAMIEELEQLGPEGVRWQMLAEEEKKARDLEMANEVAAEMRAEGHE